MDQIIKFCQSVLVFVRAFQQLISSLQMLMNISTWLLHSPSLPSLGAETGYIASTVWQQQQTYAKFKFKFEH